MEVKPGFGNPQKVSLSPKQRCPFNRGNKYKEYVNSFLGPNFVSTQKRCPKGEVPLYVSKSVIRKFNMLAFFFIFSERL